ncbi:MAG: hypothetical protein A2Y07_00985 [Planctomycetes bacterium GWF2_50_10]|nr:MAG: hypothetical protein A2Y07_00985 [Planctomycetes bacterium GWF2_50_10]
MKNNRSGFVAILGLLIVVAIGFIIYYLQFASLGGPGPRSHEKPEDQPWARESSLKDPNAKATLTTAAPKSTVKITQPLTVQALVSSSADPRGTLTLHFDPNGFLTGTWTCKYSYTHAAYNITASVTGNTDPTALANTPDGKPDRSKLVFIARGTYDQHVTNLESGEKILNKGTLYINGLLDSSHSATGKVSLTGSKNWHVDYTFKSTP